MKTTLLLLLFFLVCLGMNAQVPQGLNYQAIARDPSTGNPVTNKLLKVKLSILSDTTGFYASGIGNYVWEEEHINVKTNSYGLFTIALGTGSKVGGSASTFSSIAWTPGPLYIGIKIAVETAYVYKNMGSAKLWTVPYAMAATKAETAGKADGITSGSKLAVVSADDASSLALFEVKRKDGQTVFAVYPDAVNVYVPPTSKKGKGGFAIGGFGEAKAPSQDYFRVTPDSVRIYINDSPSIKGGKGGFAIGGFDKSKAGLLKNYYMNVSGASSVDTVKGSPQILWFPNKNAFLAGNVHIGAVDSVGLYSTALGYRSIAMGNYSQAFGYKAKAFGDYSTSIGKNSVAGVRAGGVSTASNAFSFGNGAKATGDNSYALGSGATASGYMAFAFGSVGLNDSGDPTSTPTTANAPYSFALGMGAQATQKGGLALGIGALASGYYSNSLGYYSTSSGYYSTALGYKSTASNYYAGALGYYAQALGRGSLALGYGANATADYSTAVGASANATNTYASSFGRAAVAGGGNSVAVGYGATTGISATDASAFGRSSSAVGTSSMALGTSSIANGNYSNAIGYGSSTGALALSASAFGRTAVANGQYSMALGTNTTANGNYSSAIGYGAITDAAATNSVALGTSTQAIGTNSTAIGYQSQSRGDKSIAIGSFYSYSYLLPRLISGKGSPTGETKGFDDLLPIRPIIPISTITLNFSRANIAEGQYSVAVGNGNLAQNGGFVFGSNSDAIQFGAVALGTTAKANNKNSFAAGYNTVADGIYSMAIGNNVTASSYGEIALGQFGDVITGTPDQWVESNLLLTVGNGIDATDRSNALTIYKDGKTIIRGRYAVSTLNYKMTRRIGFLFPPVYRDYVYGMYTNLNRDDAAIEYYYSGYFTSTGAEGTYYGLYADKFTTADATITTLKSSGAYNTIIGATYRDLYVDNTGLIGNLVSSARYKKDIEDLNDINWLYNLRPVSYRYKTSDSEEKEIGLIAEEVLKINPHFVSFNEKGDPETVVYSKLVTPLLKAVQDQKATIDLLKSENDMLRERLEKLENTVLNLAKEEK